MRRRLVAGVIALLILLSALHAMGVPLRRSRLEPAGMAQEGGAAQGAQEAAKTDAGEDGQDGPARRIEGRVVSLSLSEGDGGELRVRLLVAVDRCDGRRAYGERILVDTEPAALRDASGELAAPETMFDREVRLEAVLTAADGRRNPGCFDYRLYLASEGVFYRGSCHSIAVGDVGRLPWRILANRLIQKRFQFQAVLPARARALLPGLLFGDTAALSEDVYETFRKNGTAHVLAVSGLHVGILYGLLRKLLGNVQSPGRLLLLGGVLWLYGTMAMWSPSVFRAALMILLHQLALLKDLRYDMLTSLSLAALLLLLRNPYSLLGSGFQMSFLAVSSIAFLMPVLPKKIPQGLRLMLAVNLGLLPYQMFQFNTFSFVSLVANPPVLYLTGLLAPLGLGAFVVFLFFGSCGILSLPLESLSLLLIKVNEWLNLGGGSLDVPSPPLWLVFAVYGLGFFLLSETAHILRLRRRIGTLVVRCALIAALALAGGYLYRQPVASCQLVFVDVGQGDCLHIRASGHHVLIDGGGRFGYNVGEKVLKPYLLKNGVSRLDLALATHTHMDHYQGLEELEDAFPVHALRSGMTIGDSVQVAPQVTVTTLWPLTVDPVKGQDENHLCSVFLVSYAGWRVLVTGDLDTAGEEEMMAYYASIGRLDALRADVLKVGHHGSETSTGEAFLAAVDPQVAVIQVGQRNRYGHPDQVIVDRLTEKGIRLFRNDLDGAVGLSLSAAGIRVETVMARGGG